MNFKITIILSIIAISIGAFLYYYTNNTSEDVQIDPPWFYQVSMDDINFIEQEFNDIMLVDGYKNLFRFPIIVNTFIKFVFWPDKSFSVWLFFCPVPHSR